MNQFVFFKIFFILCNKIEKVKYCYYLMPIMFFNLNEHLSLEYTGHH